MTAEVRQFQPVEIPDDPPQDPAFARAANAAAASALTLALKSLSQRAIAGGKAWLMLASLASIFWVWGAVPDPSYTQIVSHSIYAIMVLAANVIVRRF